MKSRIISTVDRSIAAAVSTIVVTVLLLMVLLSFSQVVLRNVTGGGFHWADVVLRHLVLIVGMFGAVLAARGGRQIAIDVIGKLLPPKQRLIARWITGVFTVVITVIMARASIIFVASEKSFGTELSDGIAAWPFQLAIPIGFILVGLQVILNLLLGREDGPQAAPVAEEIVLPDAVDDSGEVEELVETAEPDEEGDEPEPPEADDSGEEERP